MPGNIGEIEGGDQRRLMRTMRCDFRGGFEKTHEEMAKLKGNHSGKFQELTSGATGSGMDQHINGNRKSQKKSVVTGAS